MSKVDATTEATVLTLDIGSPEFRRDAFATYRDLNAECPVHRVVAFNSDESGEQHMFFDRPVVMVTGYDAASGAMLDPRLTVDALNDPPDHTRPR